VSSDGLGSDFSFQRLTGQARASRSIGTRHLLMGRVLAGLTRGTPPPQRVLALGGLGTLRGYALKEFVGEQALLGTVEWTIETRPRYPMLVLFADGGSAWGGDDIGTGAGNGRRDRGFKADAGVGLEYRIFNRGWARVDLAVPFQPSPGADRARVYGVVRLPF
jgi:hemolysin activation/secretion protein